MSHAYAAALTPTLSQREREQFSPLSLWERVRVRAVRAHAGSQTP